MTGEYCWWRVWKPNVKISISKIIWGQVVISKMWCDGTLATPTLFALLPYNVRHSCSCDVIAVKKIFWMRPQSKKGSMAHGLSSCCYIAQDQWRLKFAKVNRKIIMCVQIRIWLLKDRLWQVIMSFSKMFIYVNKLLGIFICNPSVFISTAVVWNLFAIVC